MPVALFDLAQGLPPRRLRAVRAAMDRDGAVSLDGLFPKALLERLRREVLRRHESGELRREGLVRDIAGRYAAVLPFEGPFLDRRLWGDRRVLALMDALLGPDACIGSLEAVIALPGAYEQHLHLDGPIRFERSVAGRKVPYGGLPPDLPAYAVTLCVPLCALDEENGPTAIHPGSHKAALRARPPGDSEVRRRWPVQPMSGPFGRCFAFDFRVFHGGLPNLSREPRPLLMLVFTRSWFRDPNQNEVFPSVVIRARDLARVPRPLRRLFMLAPAARRAVWVRARGTR